MHILHILWLGSLRWATAFQFKPVPLVSSAQWSVLTSTSWSGSSPAVWWWWSACPCRGAWTSITSRKAQRFATTATPTTFSPSSSTDKWVETVSLSKWPFYFYREQTSRLRPHHSGWWCVWKSPSTSTTSKIWSCSRPCSTPPQTPQVHWALCCCLWTRC